MAQQPIPEVLNQLPAITPGVTTGRVQDAKDTRRVIRLLAQVLQQMGLVVPSGSDPTVGEVVSLMANGSLNKQLLTVATTAEIADLAIKLRPTLNTWYVPLSGGSNAAPVAQAGADNNIALPTSAVTLVGSGTDSDGIIASYGWSKISGPTVYSITSPSAASTTVTNLVQTNGLDPAVTGNPTDGPYVFRLMVTDDDGATATDDVQVTVNAAAGGNTGVYRRYAATDIVVNGTTFTAINGPSYDLKHNNTPQPGTGFPVLFQDFALTTGELLENVTIPTGAGNYTVYYYLRAEGTNNEFYVVIDGLVKADHALITPLNTDVIFSYNFASSGTSELKIGASSGRIQVAAFAIVPQGASSPIS